MINSRPPSAVQSVLSAACRHADMQNRVRSSERGKKRLAALLPLGRMRSALPKIPYWRTMASPRSGWEKSRFRQTPQSRNARQGTLRPLLPPGRRDESFPPVPPDRDETDNIFIHDFSLMNTFMKKICFNAQQKEIHHHESIIFHIQYMYLFYRIA